MIKKENLENGMKIITEHIPHVKSVAIGFWVKCGSRYEPSNLQGISHFIEHMLFKGTDSRDAKKIAEEMESVGGILNAFTSREYSCIYSRVLSEHIDLALDILVDMILNSNFPEDELEKEKNVVFEEIKMYEDTPDESIHDFFSQIAWGNHQLGQSILGNFDSISSFSRDTLLDYYKSAYTPQNIVLSISGNLENFNSLNFVKKSFSNVPNKTIFSNLETPSFNNTYLYKSKELEQTHFCLGVEGLAQDDEEIYSLMILNNILGGGASSRLFQRIREDLGLAYSIYSYQQSYKDKGLFTVYAGTSPELAPKVAKEILKEFQRLKENGITQAELERAKSQIKGNLYLSMENTSSRMSILGRTEICYDRIISIDEIVEKIYDVKVQDIRDLSSKLFNPEKMAFTAYGPEKNKFDLSDLI